MRGAILTCAFSTVVRSLRRLWLRFSKWLALAGKIRKIAVEGIHYAFRSLTLGPPARGL